MAALRRLRGLDECIMVIYGTLLGNARPVWADNNQRVAYDGHKRRTCSSSKRSSHWTVSVYIYMELRLDLIMICGCIMINHKKKMLGAAMGVERKQYAVCGDSEYARRMFWEVPVSK